MYIPKYDQGFKPAIIALREFNKKVEESNNYNELVICLERTNENNYIYKMNVYKDGWLSDWYIEEETKKHEIYKDWAKNDK